jgi:hypothetical protein
MSDMTMITERKPDPRRPFEGGVRFTIELDEEVCGMLQMILRALWAEGTDIRPEDLLASFCESILLDDFAAHYHDQSIN